MEKAEKQCVLCSHNMDFVMIDELVLLLHKEER